MINIVSFRIFVSRTFRLLFNIHLLFAFYFASKKFICSPPPPQSMLGHITSITRKNNLILSNIDPVGGGGGGGGTSRREVKRGSFPNLFVDDCRNSCSDRLFRIVFVLAENNNLPLA